MTHEEIITAVSAAITEIRTQDNTDIANTMKEMTDCIKSLTEMVMDLDRRAKHDDQRIKHLEEELYSLSRQVVRMTDNIDDQSISEPRIREVEERQSRIRILEDPPGGIMGDRNWWEHVEKLWKKL